MGEKDLRILNCPYKFWMAIMLILILVELLLIIWTIHTPDWVYTSMEESPFQNPDMLNFDGTAFKGSLFHCNSGCTGSYKSSMKDWCSYAKQTQNIPSKSICGLFVSLFYSSILFVTFQYISIFLLLLQFLCLISFTAYRKFEQVSNFASIYKIVFIFLASIMWTIINEVNFDESCKHFPQNGHIVSVCLGLGPKVSYALSGVSFVFYLINRKIMGRFKELRSLESGLSQNAIMSANQNSTTNDTFRRQSLESTTTLRSQQEFKNFEIEVDSNQPVSIETESVQRVQSVLTLDEIELKVEVRVNEES